MNHYFHIKRTVILILLIFQTVSLLSQTKAERLYLNQKYAKCIKQCEKDISDNIEKQNAILYKSLCLSEAYNLKEIQSEFNDPMYEALKGLEKLENYTIKNPKDKFFKSHQAQVKLLKNNTLSYADTLSQAGENKASLKIYKKLHEIYPEEKVYFFEIIKSLDFVSSKAIKELNIKEDYYYSELYEIIKNAYKYFKTNGKQKLEQSADILLKTRNSDLELISMFLVFLKKNYASSDKYRELSDYYKTKYWQIDLLIQVNEKRESGYTCGDEQMKSKPPLVLDNCLLSTAQKYSELMNKENHFSHTGPDGKSPWKRANEEGCSADGENIAAGSSTVSGVMRQWLDSPGHCKNMMGSHTHMGIGESGSYWVQMFR